MRVLILEDEALVAMDHAEHLADAGAEIVGPFSRVSEAMEHVERQTVDVAVIDYLLGEDTSRPLQELLDRKGVPYVIVTGYPRVLVRQNDDQAVQSKPITAETLMSAVKAARDRAA